MGQGAGWGGGLRIWFEQCPLGGQVVGTLGDFAGRVWVGGGG